MSTSEIATVLAWHDALADANLGTLGQLSSDDIELGDADGAQQGRRALRQWAESAHRDVTLGRLYVHDGVVVAEEILSDGTEQASAFRVVEDRVTSAFRHPNLASALAATALTEKDLAD